MEDAHREGKSKKGRGSYYYLCQACGYRAPKWMGRCPDCGEFGTLVEEFQRPYPGLASDYAKREQPTPIVEIDTGAEKRVSIGLSEFDRVLGGGIVTGSVVLVGGEPGIGKSTLMLQVSGGLAYQGHRILYVSGEESARQTKLRGERLGINSERLLVYPETCLEEIIVQCEAIKPFVVVVDSIQTIHSMHIDAMPGTISQLREVTGRFINLAKGLDITVFLVGHVTKEGVIAGPKLLEHMVDTVLYFEGQNNYDFRILRAAKNRFGSTNEIGVFEMQTLGLREVTNPSEHFLAERPADAPGSVVVASMGGTRPLLLELQALVTSSSLVNPRRMTTGLDNNRVCLLVAILEKKLGLHLQKEDVFLNITGGARVEEPAVDLGIAMAIASSFKDQPIDRYTVIVGEVGLAGEVRTVPHLEARIKEASKLGFKKCVIPTNSRGGKLGEGNFKTVEVSSIGEAFKEFFY